MYRMEAADTLIDSELGHLYPRPVAWELSQLLLARPIPIALWHGIESKLSRRTFFSSQYSGVDCLSHIEHFPLSLCLGHEVISVDRDCIRRNFAVLLGTIPWIMDFRYLQTVL
jgi:hypothetical protein